MFVRRDLPPPSAASKKKLLIWLCAGFFLIGIITVLLGQILPILSSRLALSDEEAGYFFIAQFSGALSGVFLYNRAIKKFGYSKTLFGGFWLMALGVVGLNSGSWFLCLSAVYLYGFGIGLNIPATNMLVVELCSEKSSPASALSLVNFFWGLGAIVCKPFVDFVGSPTSVFLPTALLAVLFLPVGAAIGFSSPQNTLGRSETSTETTTRIWKTSTAWLIAIFNFIHIGVESSVGGWITTYESRLTGSPAKGWLSAALAFFLFLVAGRAVAPLFFRFLRENSMLLLNLSLMSGGVILILSAEDFWLLTLGAAILGFGASSVFPTNMARFTNIFGAKATQNATPLFVCGSLGGAFTTWLVGYVSTAFEDLRAGFFVLLFSCLLLIVLQLLLTAKTRSK